ncbi:MAG: TRAP transporter substrate-binding protein [Alphaproteobacteria bacterium]|nr:TRAP transporter substrate-binding protein [Alphaproteobacteria bacterium]
MTTFRILITAAVLAVGVVAGARAETVLRLSTWVPPEHELNRTVFPTWARQVQWATGGRVRVEIAHNLAPPNRQFELIRDGRADVGYVFHGYYPDRFLLPQMAELPGTGVDQVASSVALWRIYQQHCAAAGEHQGVTVIGMMLHGPGVLHLKSPVTQLADLRQRRVRVPGGVSMAIGAALGIVPVSLPPTQVYMALVDGRAEGAFLPMESKESFRIKDVARYSLLMPAGFYDGSFAIVANSARLAALQPNDREALLSVSGERLSALAGRAWRAADLAGRIAAEAAGNIIAVADAGMELEFEAIFGPIEAAWITRTTRERGIDARRILAEYRAIARTFAE